MNQQFSLSLGWGAARGFAHIGVIKRLEEIWATPREISGTSIGAIIGAFYAAGYSSNEMTHIANNIKILQLVDLDLKNWLFKGNKIIQFLEKYIWDKTFADLKIPLTIVATDIDTGEKILFHEWPIINAIRASISIPGVFIPYKYKWMRLVDGWIIENLPISILSKEYPVIAVSVQLGTKKKIREKTSFFFPDGTMLSNSYNILRKTIGIMMFQNELKSLQSRDNITLIQIERNDIDYYNFKKVYHMIEEGYRAANILLNIFHSHNI